MSAPYTPQDVVAQQSDGNILVVWDASIGATSYTINRSLDGVNFTFLASSLIPQYLDTLPGIGIMYYYQVLSVNTDGSSTPSNASQMVAAPPSEMSLLELRLRAQQTADRVASGFVQIEEWNYNIRLSMYELYDLLIGSYVENYALQQVTILTSGTQNLYPLPDGVTNFLGGTYPNSAGQAPAQAFYKLAGVDLNVNTSNVTPARVTLSSFDFIKRNEYVYPNSTSTIYGVYNMRYRLMGNQLDMIPVPAGNQTLTAYYAPRLPALLRDTDLTTLGTSGWLRYVIVRTAIYALAKEEGSDLTQLNNELLFLKKRIEDMSQDRDMGSPDTISETREDPIYGGNGFAGRGGSGGGW